MLLIEIVRDVEVFLNTKVTKLHSTCLWDLPCQRNGLPKLHYRSFFSHIKKIGGNSKQRMVAKLSRSIIMLSQKLGENVLIEVVTLFGAMTILCNQGDTGLKIVIFDY